MIIVEAIVAGMLVAVARGGRLGNLVEEKLRGEWALALLLPLQIAWPNVVATLRLNCLLAVVLWLLMMATLSFVMLLNVRTRWVLSIAALGVAVNILVIGLNGGMPVSIKAASEIGGTRAAARASLAKDCLHTELVEGTRLPLLADVIAIPGPRSLRAVLSVGDVLLAAGLAGWVFTVVDGRSNGF